MIDTPHIEHWLAFNLSAVDISHATLQSMRIFKIVSFLFLIFLATVCAKYKIINASANADDVLHFHLLDYTLFSSDFISKSSSIIHVPDTFLSLHEASVAAIASFAFLAWKFPLLTYFRRLDFVLCSQTLYCPQ